MKTLWIISALAIAAFGPASAAAPLYHLVKTVPLGGGIKWDYLYFDSATDQVYIAHGPVVTVVDAGTFKVAGTLLGLPGSHGIAADPASGLVYADSAEKSVVVAFDPHDFKPVATAKVLLDADGINYDPASKQMYVSGGDGNGLTPVSTRTHQPAPDIALGTSPEFHVADGAGSEYVDLVDANAIARIDTATNKLTATWPTAPCTYPKGLAVDPATRRLFASCANGTAVVMDADTGRIIAALSIGKGTDAADFDPKTKRFFSSNGDGTLTVVAATGPDKFTILCNEKTAPGARTMALDPASGRIFLVTGTVTRTIPPADPSDHPHYVFAPGSLKLLVYGP